MSDEAAPTRLLDDLLAPEPYAAVAVEEESSARTNGTDAATRAANGAATNGTDTTTAPPLDEVFRSTDEAIQAEVSSDESSDEKTSEEPVEDWATDEEEPEEADSPPASEDSSTSEEEATFDPAAEDASKQEDLDDEPEAPATASVSEEPSIEEAKEGGWDAPSEGKTAPDASTAEEEDEEAERADAESDEEKEEARSEEDGFELPAGFDSVADVVNAVNTMARRGELDSVDDLDSDLVEALQRRTAPEEETPDEPASSDQSGSDDPPSESAEDASPEKAEDMPGGEEPHAKETAVEEEDPEAGPGPDADERTLKEETDGSNDAKEQEVAIEEAEPQGDVEAVEGGEETEKREEDDEETADTDSSQSSPSSNGIPEPAESATAEDDVTVEGDSAEAPAANARPDEADEELETGAEATAEAETDGVASEEATDGEAPENEETFKEETGDLADSEEQEAATEESSDEGGKEEAEKQGEDEGRQDRDGDVSDSEKSPSSREEEPTDIDASQPSPASNGAPDPAESVAAEEIEDRAEDDEDDVADESDSTEPPAGDGLPASDVDIDALETPDSERELLEDTPVPEDSEEPDAGSETDDLVENLIDDNAVDQLASRMASGESLSSGTSDRVVDMLLRRDAIEMEVVEAAQKRKEEENRTGAALWRLVAEESGVDKEVVYRTASQIYAFEVADLDEHPPDPQFTRSLVEDFGDEYQERLLDLQVVPHRRGSKTQGRSDCVFFVTHDPMRPEVHRVIRSLDLDRFQLQYAPESAVSALVSEAFRRENEYLERVEEESAVDLGQNFEEEDSLIDEERLEEEINRSTLINLFEAMLVEAVRDGVSDIHVYPNSDKQVEVHFRKDGQLEHWHTEDRVHPEALLSVIKDNVNRVDRFKSDAAQDGSIQRWIDGTRIRFRVSIMPIAAASDDIRAESVVIRVLDDRKVITDITKLGLDEVALDRFEKAINQPYGMNILTGPTGSGKSTTLVAALNRVMSPEVNALTIEDPVEYFIEGARQIKLSDKLQLKDALRSILRHDPDIVMVGEMRDQTTAELAIKLANTGHLTFSTLHTNDAPSAVSRLYKMGIEPFLIAYAINLVVAQRLIRTLCPTCKRPDPDPDPIMLEHMGFSEQEVEETTFYVPGDDDNCQECGGMGYTGRRAIAEALYFTQPIRHMIVEADDMVDESAIREHAEEEDGMLSLQDSAREVVKAGETSVKEMMRVVAS